MKNTAAFAAVASVVLLAVGCSPEPEGRPDYHKVIPAERMDEAIAWVNSTVKAANPMSDEEPEDNIRQAQRTAEEMYGELRLGMWFAGTFVPIEKLTPTKKARAEEWANSL